MTGPGRLTVLVALSAPLAFAGCGDEAGPLAGSSSTTQADTPSPKPTETGDGEGGVALAEIGTFEQPVYVTQAPGGNDALYVVEQTGRVQRVPPDGGEPELFLDLSDEVSCCSEQGLLSLAFAPDYAKSGLMYVNYTNADGDTRVVEFTLGEDGLADPATAREVLAVDQPESNHNGGLVVFGPDGHLYIGMGDGGGAGDPDRNGQSTGTLLGKLLRIDPAKSSEGAYAVPKDNPYADGGGEAGAIYSIGLRNPWRFSFDRDTGDLWIGDVGQSALEEVDGVAAGDGKGANFGWSAFEGDARFNEDQNAPGHVPPVLTYGREEGCSVTGGYVVRDPDLTSLYGRYLYGDYCEGELRSFTAEPGRPAEDDTFLDVQVPGLSSFGEDADGNVYATSLEGPVYRLDPAS